jgi:hypothetical protein
MKITLLVLGVLLATAAVAPRANAQNYPWCAIYSAFGARNCGFASFEQCQENLRGIGGVCNPNAMYQPPPGPHPHSRKSSF